MGKRIVVAVILVVAAAIVVFDLSGGKSLLYRGNNRGGSRATTPIQTADRQRAGSNRGGGSDGADPFPAGRLDRALENATYQIEVPKGVHSSEIPEDNALHWFLIAAEQMPPQVPYDVVNEILDNGWRDDAPIIDLIAKCQPAFDAIREGIETGNLKFPDAAPGEPIPYSAKWRTLARLMTAEALMKADRRDCAAGLGELADVMDFGVQSCRSGDIGFYFSATYIQHLAASHVSAILESPGVSAEQCRAFIARLKAMEERAPRMADALLAEADLYDRGVQNFASAQEVHELLLMYVQYDGPGTDFVNSVSPEQCKQWYGEMPGLVRAAAPLFEAPIYEFKKDALRPLVDANPLSQRLMGNFFDLAASEARAKVTRLAPLMMAAIETHRRENGAYPESLDALAPSVLEELPSDPFTGSPFLYRRDGNRYVLYSAGADMRDDGGRGKPWDHEASDYIIAR